jgi:hypothetical protein
MRQTLFKLTQVMVPALCFAIAMSQSFSAIAPVFTFQVLRQNFAFFLGLQGEIA